MPRREYGDPVPEQRGDHRLEVESADEPVENAELEPEEAACHERPGIERRREVAEAHAERLGRWIDTTTQRAKPQKSADFELIPQLLVCDGGITRGERN